jgi:regulatory LuxR family protein
MKEVGSILNVTPRTVAFHKYWMMEKLGAKRNAELVRYAVRNRTIMACSRLVRATRRASFRTTAAGVMRNTDADCWRNISPSILN